MKPILHLYCCFHGKSMPVSLQNMRNKLLLPISTNIERALGINKFSWFVVGSLLFEFDLGTALTFVRKLGHLSRLNGIRCSL